MERDPVGPIRIGVQRKILLLLMDNRRYMDDFEVPEVLSQKGIGRELGLRQNHVSRALSELREEGLVGSRTAHIKGVGRRRKIYFLKEKGVHEVNEFIRSLQNKRVPVRIPDSGLKYYSIAKTQDLLMKRIGTKPSPYQLLTSYYDGSEIDLVKGRKDHSSQSPPITRYFFGREREMEELTGALNDRSIPIISVVSLAGMGKTTLMAKALSGRNDRISDWMFLTEWTGPERLLSQWARFLSASGRTALLDFLGKRGFKDPEGAVDALLRDLRDLNAVFVLDDYHKTTGRIDDMLSLIMSRLRDGNHTIIIGSRERPGFYGKNDLQIKGSIYEICLEGLDRESSMKLLEERGIPLPERERIFFKTKGHPLSLELICRTCLEDPQGLTTEIEDYLGKELISGLNDIEKEVLCLASVYEEPVVPDGLLLLTEADRSVLDSLKEKLIIRVYPDGTMDIHDLLRHNLRGWMGQKKLERLTERAITFLSGRGSEREVLHYIVLLDRSGRTEDINRLFLDHGEEFIEMGNSNIIDHIRHMDGADLVGMDRMRYLILKADLGLTLGDLKKSRERLNEALKISGTIVAGKEETEELFELISRIYNLKAEASRLEGKEKEVISHHLENVRRSRKHGNPKSLGKALNNLAQAYKNAGQLNKALISLKEASQIFEKEEDPLSLLMVEINLSELLVMKGKAKEGRKLLRKTDRFQTRPSKLESRLKHKTGKVRLMLGDHEAAMSDLQRSYNCSIDSGDRQNAAYSMCDIVEASIKIGDSKTAVSSLKNLIPFIMSSREDEIWNRDIAWCFLENSLSLRINEVPESMAKGLIRSIDVIISMEGNMKVLSGLEEIRKRYPGSPILIRTLETASGLFKEKGDLKASSVVSLWLAEEYIKAGDRKKARTILEGVVKNSGRTGFEKAAKKAENMMKQMKKISNSRSKGH